jgi:hypothetical protein
MYDVLFFLIHSLKHVGSKIGYFKVEFLSKYESILKNALTHGSVSRELMFDENYLVTQSLKDVRDYGIVSLTS